MEKIKEEYYKKEAGRKWFIKKTLEAMIKKENWQCNFTKYDFCEHIIKKTNLLNKKILVLFNIEIVEVLINIFDVSIDKIYFVADTELEHGIAQTIYKVKSILCISTKTKELERIIKGMSKIFDLGFSNPPYGIILHLDILQKIFPYCNEIIYVHPATWLLSKKFNESQLFTNTKNLVKNDLCEVDIIDAKKIFETSQQTPNCIIHINKTIKHHEIKVNLYDKYKYSVSDINDINNFYDIDGWSNTIKPFKNKIESYVKKHSSIRYKKWNANNRWEHLCNIDGSVPKNKFYCMIKPRGYKTNTYEIIDPNIPANIIKFENTKKRYLSFWFDTNIQLTNFLNYLNTNFVRFCYAIYKGGHDIYNDLGLIPVINFNQKWIDADLYKKFKIDNRTQKYITNFFKDLEIKK